MSFRSYSQEAPTNSEPFSLDEAFNLFLPERFTLSPSAVDFILNYVGQLPGFVHPTEGTSPSSLVLTNFTTSRLEDIPPSTYPVTSNSTSSRQ